jgi:uncharacterized protein (TIGR03435 family)
MLQTLLADRLKLVVHYDTRPVLRYALSLGKGWIETEGCERDQDTADAGRTATACDATR